MMQVVSAGYSLHATNLLLPIRAFQNSRFGLTRGREQGRVGVDRAKERTRRTNGAVVTLTRDAARAGANKAEPGPPFRRPGSSPT